MERYVRFSSALVIPISRGIDTSPELSIEPRQEKAIRSSSLTILCAASRRAYKAGHKGAPSCWRIEK
jgi:hypothetical protein